MTVLRTNYDRIVKSGQNACSFFCALKSEKSEFPKFLFAFFFVKFLYFVKKFVILQNIK